MIGEGLEIMFWFFVIVAIVAIIVALAVGVRIGMCF
jgi:hypothetical protein